MKRIRNQVDLQYQLKALLQTHPQLAPIRDRVDEVPLRLRAPGMPGLTEIIVSQQVSKQSAAAMMGRMLVLVNPLTPGNLLRGGNQPMIEAGLSRAKQATLIGVAERMLDGRLNLDQLCEMDIESAQQTLVAVKGIGPWTAEVFLLFCAGHVDIFPAGDVALQHAVGVFFETAVRPDEKTCRELVEPWAPHRAVAARLMWAYYSQLKGGRNILPV